MADGALPGTARGARVGWWLLLAANVLTVVIVAVADALNRTHLFNPDWPGHARFHIGMQFATLCLLTALGVWALGGDRWRSRPFLLLGAAAPATFWPGLFVAYLIPGTDVYATEELRQVGVPINLATAVVVLVVTAVGYRLAAR